MCRTYCSEIGFGRPQSPQNQPLSRCADIVVGPFGRNIPPCLTRVLPHRRRTPNPADIAYSSPTNPLLVALVRSKLVPWSLWSHQHGSCCSANRGRTVWFRLANNLGRTIWFCLAPITKRRSNYNYQFPATIHQLYQLALHFSGIDLFLSWCSAVGLDFGLLTDFADSII